VKRALALWTAYLSATASLALTETRAAIFRNALPYRVAPGYRNSTLEAPTRRVSRRSVIGIVIALSSFGIHFSYAQTAGLNEEYRIGPEDVLEISVWKEEGLERQVLVRPDGGISFPLAGDVRAAGKTARELRREITKRIQKYIPDAVVTVSVVKLSGYTIFVLGKVKQPGQFVVGRYVDVLQALTLAGGLTAYASEDDIKILRRDKTGKEQVFSFDYDDMKDGKNLSQNIILKSGDVIVVP
jgi:polysaccharide export outer membrane protein